MSHAELVSTAMDLLRRKGGSQVKLGEPQELHSQFTVLRVPVCEGDGLPASLVIKQIPADAPFGADKRFRSEWAGLTFANSIATDTRFAPQIIAGDIEERLIILEDLGEVQDLNAHLHDASVDGIALLNQYGKFLGTMHAASIGRQSEFEAIQQDFDATVPLSDSSIDLRNGIDKLTAAFAPNPKMSEGLTEEILRLSAAIHEDAQFSSFSHCDAGPHNVLVTEEGLYFVDFEFSTYCHPFMDMTAVHLAFPPFWHGHPIPQVAIKAYESAYRETLGATIPDIMDDAMFELMVEQCCAKWILGKFINLGEKTYPVFVRNELDIIDNPDSREQVPKGRNFRLKIVAAYLKLFAENARLKATYAVLESLYEETLKNNSDIEAFVDYEAF